MGRTLQFFAKYQVANVNLMEEEVKVDVECVEDKTVLGMALGNDVLEKDIAGAFEAMSKTNIFSQNIRQIFI